MRLDLFCLLYQIPTKFRLKSDQNPVGIRPKLQWGGEAMDFILHDEAQHGVPNLINVFGIESPGLTSSLSLAEEIASMHSRLPMISSD